MILSHFLLVSAQSRENKRKNKIQYSNMFTIKTSERVFKILPHIFLSLPILQKQHIRSKWYNNLYQVMKKYVQQSYISQDTRPIIKQRK